MQGFERTFGSTPPGGKEYDTVTPGAQTKIDEAGLNWQTARDTLPSVALLGFDQHPPNTTPEQEQPKEQTN